LEDVPSTSSIAASERNKCDRFISFLLGRREVVHTGDCLPEPLHLDRLDVREISRGHEIGVSAVSGAALARR
jgi:hypothetical protein